MDDEVTAEPGGRRRVHLVLSSHWDREWRESFEELRFDLVRLMDGIVEGLESGRLRTPFVTDGQTSLVEDYLEIRPELRERVEALLARGEIRTGPWYTMPDEFLVSGESLVRNLELGQAQARAWGCDASRAGLVCDMFGHNSQLPQILAGFGAPGALIWRGVNTQWRSLLWRGADGTELPVHRFGPHGYGSYAYSVRNGFHYDAPVPAPAQIETYLAAELAATPSGPVLFYDGCDHQECDAPAYEALLRHVEGWPQELELVHSDLDRFLAELGDGLTPSVVLEGELREPGLTPFGPDNRAVEGDEQWMIPGIASSRVYLKQANARCEALLTQWVEPFAAAARAVAGVEQAPGFAERAWKLLLANHAHDSIGGCSVDLVHRDMEHRFDQVEAIGEKVTRDALSKLGASVAGDLAEDELRVTVFNPSLRARRCVHEIDLQIPVGWPSFQEFFGYEPKPAFRIYDGVSGEELAYQRLSQMRGRNRARIRPTKLLEEVHHDVVRVAVEVDLPSLGYTTLVVRAADAEAPFTRHPVVPGIATGGRSMANEHLAIEIERDGTLTVTDRHADETYRGLLAFEDAADIGDGWFHGPAVNDEVLYGSDAVEVTQLADGPQLARFRVAVTLHVPASFEEGSQRRSEHRVPMRVKTEVTLRKGARELELHTEVVNPAKDHRLRVLFPTGTSAETSLGDSPFDVVERPVALRPDTHRYRELETEMRPHSSWTAACEEGRGLALVGVGLHEAAVRDLPERPIALSLFRCTGRTAFTNREPEGQMLGRSLSFDYAVRPIAQVDRAGLCELGQRLAAGAGAVQLAPADVATHRTPHALPASASFGRLDGDVVLTSLRTVDGMLEARAFNPNAHAVEATLALDGLAAAGDAQLVRLDGEPLAPLPREADGSCSLRFAPKQVVTVRIPIVAGPQRGPRSA